MNILMMVFLRVVSVYLTISIFNTINFICSANAAAGKKLRLNPRRLRVAIKFGFGWRRSIFHWLLDWYFGLFNFDKLVQLMRGN